MKRLTDFGRFTSITKKKLRMGQDRAERLERRGFFFTMSENFCQKTIVKKLRTLVLVNHLYVAC